MKRETTGNSNAMRQLAKHVTTAASADSRTILVDEPILFSELRSLIGRLPATYEYAESGDRRERRLFHVTLGEPPAGGWRVDQFAVLGDADKEFAGSATVLLLADCENGFRLGSHRRDERVYKSQDALEADLIRLAGEGQRVKVQLYKNLTPDPQTDA